MGLGSKSMSFAMLVAWMVATFTGVPILIVSVIALRIVWALVGRRAG